jgi:hypothetical protein
LAGLSGAWTVNIEAKTTLALALHCTATDNLSQTLVELKGSNHSEARETSHDDQIQGQADESFQLVDQSGANARAFSNQTLFCEHQGCGRALWLQPQSVRH